MRDGRTTEWVGGCVSVPLYVLEGEPQRPDLVLWLELPSQLVVGMRLGAPRLSSDDVASTLAEALEQPLAPAASRPTRLRVADDALAAAVRLRVGDAVPVTVAPTPELPVVVRDMARFLREHGDGGGPTWLEGGRVPEPVVDGFFRAAAALWREAPWKVADDSQVLAVDIPAFGLRGACLSVIGALRQNFGFVLFESVAAFEAFAASAPPEGEEPTRPPDLSGYTLSLNFERRRDLPPAMRREVEAHRWPVAGPSAYPVVLCPDLDAVARPPGERDVRLAAACAEALAAFTRRHRGALACDPVVPSREEITVDTAGEQVVVRLRLPHPVAAEAPAAPSMPLVLVGRNDPCSCGSGRKYKKCHLRLDQGDAAADPGDHALALHALDERLVGAMLHYESTRIVILNAVRTRGSERRQRGSV
jgi:SEC-C motif